MSQQQETVPYQKPGKNNSKNSNRAFKQKQQKNYKNNKNAYIYSKDFYDLALWKNNKTQKEAEQQKLYKVGRHGNRLSGFNFKKCSSTKYLYGTGMYTYTRRCETFNQQLDQQRNINKKQNAKLRNKICMNYENI